MLDSILLGNEIDFNLSKENYLHDNSDGSPYKAYDLRLDIRKDIHCPLMVLHELYKLVDLRFFEYIQSFRQKAVLDLLLNGLLQVIQVELFNFLSFFIRFQTHEKLMFRHLPIVQWLQ